MLLLAGLLGEMISKGDGAESEGWRRGASGHPGEALGTDVVVGKRKLGIGIGMLVGVKLFAPR